MKKLAENIGGIDVIRFTLTQDPQRVREIALALVKICKNTVFAAAYEYGGKPNLLLAYTQDLVDAGHNAGKDIREAAKFIQGGGGGQNGLASAGGKNSAGLKDALEAMVDISTR